MSMNSKLEYIKSCDQCGCPRKHETSINKRVCNGSILYWSESLIFECGRTFLYRGSSGETQDLLECRGFSTLHPTVPLNPQKVIFAEDLEEFISVDLYRDLVELNEAKKNAQQ